MHRTDADAATVDGRFTDGDPGTGAQATVLGAKWLNNLQEEVCTVVETGGQVLNEAANNQLLLAIRRLIREEMQPLGSFWLTTLTTPAGTYWGFGTWVKRPGAIYGQTDGDPQFATLGAVGSRDHSHTTGDHALTGPQVGPHRHFYRDRYLAETNSTLSGLGAVNREYMPAGYNGNAGTDGADNNNDAFAYIDMQTELNTPAGQPHNHGNTGNAAALPVGRVIYIWERTA
jgi:hypothetical protein